MAVWIVGLAQKDSKRWRKFSAIPERLNSCWSSRSAFPRKLPKRFSRALPVFGNSRIPVLALADLPNSHKQHEKIFRGRTVDFLRYSSLREPAREDRRETRGRRSMKADIDFENGTITLICSKCRQKFPRRIAQIGSSIRIRCKCNSVVSWQGDLSWVTCCANPYHWNEKTSLR